MDVMIPLRSTPTRWLTAPSRVRWLPAPQRPTVAPYARSVGLLAFATLLGVAMMASAPRADQTRLAEPVENPPTATADAPIVSTPPADWFAPAAIARHATFSPAGIVGPPVDSFLPGDPHPARDWKEEEFASVAVVDGRTLLAGTTRIRLLGLDLPMPEQVCRTLDGRLELCMTRAATQLELLTRWRRVTCHYRLENAQEAVGRCRTGMSDLTERMVKSGYAWQSASPV